jgi:hypothetical protein
MRRCALEWCERRVFPYGLLPLWSLTITSGGKTTWTQLRARSAYEAFETLLDRRYKHIMPLLGATAPEELSSGDNVSFIRMTGLTNMWLGQAGRQGKYITAVLAKTVPGRKAS